MENRIVEIENQIAELQKNLRDTLREIVIAKLSKLNMLKGSSKVSTSGYKNADGVDILSIWLNDKGDGLGYTFYVGSKPAPFTPEDSFPSIYNLLLYPDQQNYNYNHCSIAISGSGHKTLCTNCAENLRKWL